MRNTPRLPGGSVCPAGLRLRSRLAQTLDDCGVGHAAALAHGLQAVATSALLKCVHEPLVTLVASAANLASSSSAALRNSGLGSTTISDDGLT
jgi:hypothetical protein